MFRQIFVKKKRSLRGGGSPESQLMSLLNLIRVDREGDRTRVNVS